MSYFTPEDKEALDAIRDIVAKYNLAPNQISLLVMAFQKGREFESRNKKNKSSESTKN